MWLSQQNLANLKVVFNLIIIFSNSFERPQNKLKRSTWLLVPQDLLISNIYYLIFEQTQLIKFLLLDLISD